MNTISKTHQLFSEYLENPRVLENPEEFLGENFEAVLNFWLILDDLSEEQLKKVDYCYCVFFQTYSEWHKAVDLAWKVTDKVVGEDYADKVCAASNNIKSMVVCYATLELIGMHKILEDHQKPLTFFNMFLEVL